MVRLRADLDGLEIGARVQRVLRLTKVHIPDGRRGLEVGIDAAVRLVVDNVDLACIARNHPRKHGGVALFARQIDRLRPARAAIG